MTSLLRILALWRARARLLLLGAALAIAAAAAGLALMALSGTVVAAIVVGGAVSAPLWLRVAGPARVALRYLERLVSHSATFRAVADLRASRPPCRLITLVLAPPGPIWPGAGLGDLPCSMLGFLK